MPSLSVDGNGEGVDGGIPISRAGPARTLPTFGGPLLALGVFLPTVMSCVKTNHPRSSQFLYIFSSISRSSFGVLRWGSSLLLAWVGWACARPSLAEALGSGLPVLGCPSACLGLVLDSTRLPSSCHSACSLRVRGSVAGAPYLAPGRGFSASGVGPSVP